MTKKLDDRKYRVIQEIIKIEDENLLSAVEKQLEQVSSFNEGLWERVMSPMQRTITIDQMIKEQNYKPLSADDFFEQAAELEIIESIEDLLSELE